MDLEFNNYEKLYLLFQNGTIFLWFFSVIIFFYSNRIKNNHLISLDFPSRWKSRGTIKLGRIIWKDKFKHQFYLNIEDLAQHMFITGITGSGKSNFMQYFLIQLTKNHKDIPFLLTEFKGEYQYLQKKIKNILILKPGENFSINIFDPEGSNPNIHAERIFKIFQSGGLFDNIEYSPQMEKYFIDILKIVIKKPEYRSWTAFKKVSQEIFDKKRDSMIDKSITAIENRIRRYYSGTLIKLFKKTSKFKVKDLFDKKIILDLHSIIKLGGEKEDALFFLNMILKYLWDKNLEKGSKNYKGIQHITIIEDAQYFAPHDLSSKTRLTSYLEDVALLLRGTGECLISLATRPNISREILNNAGVLVCFQLHMHKELMHELLNLEECQVKYLSELQKGQFIIRVNSIDKPFLLQNPYIERYWLTNNEIITNNNRIIENKKLIMKDENNYREINEPTSIHIKKREISKTIIKDIIMIPSEEAQEGDIALCNFCGNEIYGNDGFCKNCSTILKTEDKELLELKKLCREISKKKI